ncbi:Cyanovirin-N [Aspergillus pseudoustus]|uniref:Cyanovirin-N n=1 Tax=Aspergillus pseudoustus TaxID=1810923 RepID=A0ABR4IMR5_9EURO
MVRSPIALILTSAAVVAAAGFSSECTDVSVTSYWLIGTCPDDNGDDITSSVFLPYKLSNQNGDLEWAVDGKYYQSCSDCSLSGANFSCTCRDSTNHNQATSINLEEHISNYSGHLLSNQTGAITTVPANSSTPVPSDFSGTLGLDTIDATCSSAGLTVSLNSPSDCYYANLGVTISYLSGETSGNQGYEIKFYSDLECTSEVLATVTDSDDDTCVAFEEAALAWSVIPLWNADW